MDNKMVAEFISPGSFSGSKRNLQGVWVAGCIETRWRFLLC